MRYNNIDTLAFNDTNGNEYSIKDIRPLTDLETGLIVTMEHGIFIDELSSRPAIYGDNAEDLSYLIVDHNAEKLVENDFDLSKLKKINIPIIE